MRAHRARALRELPGRLAAAARPRCGRTSPPSTRSRGRPTTSPTRARWRRPSAIACSTTGRRGCTRRRLPPSSSDPSDRVFAAVAQTRRLCELDIQLFDDLLSAFRQDVETRRYAEWSGVLDYCRRSANPVGRLVLGIAGHRGRDVEQASDGLCTALQLANFWQDFGVDYRRGRIYLPAEVSGRRRAQEGDLAAGVWTEAWREAFDEAVRRTRILFDQGRPVADLVTGRLRLELRVTWLGGMRILDRAAAPGRNPLESRPSLGAGDVPGLLWRAIRWRGR